MRAPIGQVHREDSVEDGREPGGPVVEDHGAVRVADVERVPGDPARRGLGRDEPERPRHGLEEEGKREHGAHSRELRHSQPRMCVVTDKVIDARSGESAGGVGGAHGLVVIRGVQQVPYGLLR